MAVRIADGRITDVRPAHRLTATTEPIVDWTDHTVCPGYVDTHVHLVFNHDADHAPIRHLVETATPDALAIVAARSAVDCLLAGITTVRDCGDRGFVTLSLRDAIDAGTLPGPRILAAGPPLTITGGHMHWCGAPVDSTDAIRATVRQLCTRGVDFIKVTASGGFMTAESNPRQPQFTREELEVIVTEAHRSGRRVAAHASNTESIRRSVQAGVDTVEHCLWRSPTGGIEYDPAVVAEMIERGVWANLTISGISRMLLPEHSAEVGPEHQIAAAMTPTGTLWEDYQWARDMRAAGALMMLSSDAGVRFTPFRRFDESLRCAIVALDITFADAVVLATSRAAEGVGIGDEVGSIVPGSQADVLILDGLVTEQTTEVPAIRQVWRRGTPVVNDGHLIVGAPV